MRGKRKRVAGDDEMMVVVLNSEATGVVVTGVVVVGRLALVIGFTSTMLTVTHRSSE